MSAVNPNSGDREGEALRRAQRAHEPSMEEILASIRSMIVDERQEERTAPFRPASPRAVSPAPQIVYSKNDPAPQRATQEALARAETPRAPETKPAPEIAKPSVDPRSAAGGGASRENASGASVRAAVGPHREAALEPLEDPLPENEPLLSRETGQTVNSAFEALSANLAVQGVEMARGMAREMLRPMLKAWLDENLPGIVERLVRAEIERVARGFR